MSIQYGELKNGLRAYIIYTATEERVWNEQYHIYVNHVVVNITNAGIMAPGPVAKDITLAAGDYKLYMDGMAVDWTSRAAHTFAKGSSDRWQQVFLDGYIDYYNMGHTGYTVELKIRRETSPIYQTVASVPIPAKPSYTVSYSANGGSGAPASQTKWRDERLFLQAGKPTRTGYTFRCWNTKQNGTGTNYSPSQEYTANSGVTLYAQWNPISVTLSYNANGGSNAPGSQTKVYDTSLKLQTGVPTRGGYTFRGWATTQARANAGTVDYLAGSMYSANSTSNIVLWAVWSANPYTVSYDANGGTGAPDPQTKYHGTDLKLSDTVPVRPGYAFKNWNTKRDGSGTRFDAGGTYTVNSVVTLYAQWEAFNLIKRYDANGDVHLGKLMVYDENGVLKECSIAVYDADGNRKYAKV